MLVITVCISCYASYASFSPLFSDALERVFYPWLDNVSGLPTLRQYKEFPCKNEIEGFQKIIFEAALNNVPNPRFLEMLRCKVEDLVFVTSKHLSFQETEVCSLLIFVVCILEVGCRLFPLLIIFRNL